LLLFVKSVRTLVVKKSFGGAQNPQRLCREKKSEPPNLTLAGSKRQHFSPIRLTDVREIAAPAPAAPD
jgi:hypothetical protein